MQNEFYQSKKSTRLMRLFWKAAGADRLILEQSTYGDQIKYVCLGGIIVATGVMAAIAGGYAFYTIFEPKGSALDSFNTVSGIEGNYDHTDLATAIKASLFGLIWGAIIFNIDRFIVTSTGKGDGTEAITRKELVGALPRLIMGAIIALTISKPVEIRMFKTEIDVALHAKQIEQEQLYKSKTDSLFNAEIGKKDKEILKIENDINQKKQRYTELEKNYIEEARKVTVGPRALAVKAQMDELAAEIKLQENERDVELKKGKKVAAGLDGLLERIKLAHEIAGWVISLFVTLLFMTIELTPIFFKLMLIKSPYDFMEENIKELIKANHGIEIKHNFYPHGEGIERDKVVNHEVVKMLREKIKVLETQTELSDQAMEAWKKKKLGDIAENPDHYIAEEA
jgi:TM2 domain-containing membrane protein YozV